MPSSSANPFPLPFNALREVSGERGTVRFVVGAMFTASYADKAERLARSCAKWGLQYAIHQVPAVHRSDQRPGRCRSHLHEAEFQSTI
jgi:hypothetical protein